MNEGRTPLGDDECPLMKVSQVVRSGSRSTDGRQQHTPMVLLLVWLVVRFCDQASCTDDRGKVKTLGKVKMWQ